MTWQTVPAQYVIKSELGYDNKASIFLSFLCLEILSKEVFWSSEMKSIMPNWRYSTLTWSVHTEKGSLLYMLHRKDRRLLLTLDTASGSLTWVMAVPFIVSGLAAAQSHDQGHRRPPLSLPHSSDAACNSVRRLTVLYPSSELSFQALKLKTDVSEESFHLLHGKGQGRDEAEPSAEGRGLFPQKRCHVGQKGGNRNGASPQDSLGCPQQAETRPQRPKPRAPTQCCPGEDTRPSQSRPGGPRTGRGEGAHTVISC